MLMYDDDFHKEMRKRMKFHYYECGGKIKKQIRDYVTRYKIDKEILNDCDTVEKKLELVKNIAEQQKKKKMEERLEKKKN